MPRVTTSLGDGGLGLLLPPMPPADSGSTTGSPDFPTFGSTGWVIKLAAGAEEAGAHGVWASDHLFWRQPATECLTTLAVAAAATRGVTVGSCVLQLPLRAPAAVAKQAAALQVLSGGRAVLGVGVGSHPGEYELANVRFGSRGRALDAGITLLRAACGTADGPGEYRLSPAPPVPVWVGGNSPAAIRRAATAGDGWMPLFIAPREYAASLRRLDEAAAAAGRAADAVTRAVVMVATARRDRQRARDAGTTWLSRLYGLPQRAFERHLVAGPATHCADVAAEYMEAGAEHVVVLIADDDALGQFQAITTAFDGSRARPRHEAAPSPEVAGRPDGAWTSSNELAEVGA